MKKVLLASTLLIASLAFGQATQSNYTYQAPGNVATTTIPNNGGLGGGLGVHNILDGGTGGTYLGCLGCHHPHDGNTSSEQNGKLMLFRWDGLNNTYPVFSEGDTTQFAALGPASGISDGDAAEQSLLCMGCHDGNVTGAGTFAATSMGTATPAPSITPSGTSTLAGSHPVNYIYGPGGDMASLDGTGDGITVTTTVGTDNSSALPLFASAALGNAVTVQCTSCHNQHDSSNVPFLRVDNANNQDLCLTCHVALGN